MCISMTKTLSTHGLITVSNLVFCQLAHLALCLLQGKCPHEKQPGPNLLQFLPFFTVFMLIGFPGDDPSHSSWCSTSHLDYGFSLTKNSILKKKTPETKQTKTQKKKKIETARRRGAETKPTVLTPIPLCNATSRTLENTWTDACDTCDASSPPTLPHKKVSRANKTIEGEISPEFCCRHAAQTVFIQDFSLCNSVC